MSELMEWLKTNWLELTIISAVIGAFVKFNLRLREHDRHGERIKKHEEKCDQRYEKIDTTVTGVHQRVTTIGEDVAMIKGMLTARKGE